MFTAWPKPIRTPKVAASHMLPAAAELSASPAEYIRPQTRATGFAPYRSAEIASKRLRKAPNEILREFPTARPNDCRLIFRSIVTGCRNTPDVCLSPAAKARIVPPAMTVARPAYFAEGSILAFII